MKTFIGIDLGTSSVKLLLVAENGKILKSVSESYPVSYPQKGWSEQEPSDWLNAVKTAVPTLLQGHNSRDVCGIGFGGQMHGLVILDKNDCVIRPCILWNDGRTEKQTSYLNDVVGKEKLSALTANIAFAGFTAPKILWLRENEKENFARIEKIMLPKDYLAYCLTGVFATDYSDASGTLLLDVKNKRWSEEMLNVCSVSRTWLPRLYESYEKIGVLKEEFAKSWGLREDVFVVIGGGDNAVAAIGVGVTGDGGCNVSLGTSGTVFIAQDEFSVDSSNALHTFVHANGKFHRMGCILSAASCNAWWIDVINGKDFAKEQQGAEELLGKNDVYFLPYLMGERSPHNDVNARGAFIGLTPTTTRLQMTVAVMEGVAYALRDCIEVAGLNGVNVSETKICGGGAKSPLWRKIIANVCGVTVDVPTVEEGPSYGSALLAMVGSGVYKTVEEAVSKTVAISERIAPSPQTAAAYDAKYAVFKKLYPALKEVYKNGL